MYSLCAYFWRGFNNNNNRKNIRLMTSYPSLAIPLNLAIILLTVYMHSSEMLGMVETPLKNSWMKLDTTSAVEVRGSASL